MPRRLARLVLGLALALAPVSAFADPATIVSVLVYAAYALITATTAAYIYAAIAIALTLVAYALRSKPQQPNAIGDLSNRQIMSRNPAAVRSVVLGQVPVSGPIIFWCTSSTGPAGNITNGYLHIVIPLSFGEVAAITDCWLNDDLIADANIGSNGWVIGGKYAPYVFSPGVEFFDPLGTPSFTVNQDPYDSISCVIGALDATEWNFAPEAALIDVSPAAPVAWNEFKRVGRVFTFSAALAPYLADPANGFQTSPGLTCAINYRWRTLVPRVRIKRYLGAPTQVADADLIAASSSSVFSFTFTGSITGSVLHCDVPGVQPLAVQQVISGPGVTLGTKIISLGSGAGGVGNYNLNTSQSVVSQTLTSTSPAKWTSAHRGQGQAYLYVTLVYDVNLFANGLPNIKAMVRGPAFVRDPRTGLSPWSDNAALLCRAALSAKWGFGAPDGEIDDAATIAAANICDEVVTADHLGNTQKRYVADGTWSTDQKPLDLLGAILGSMAGSATYSGGQWRLLAGSYRTPLVTLTEDDLRDAMTVSTKIPRQSNFNAVRGTYVDPTKYWQPGDFPPVRNPAYVAQDQNVEAYTSIDLVYTVDAIAAQRLAKITLERGRRQTSIKWPGKLSCLPIRPWDVVLLTSPTFGWTNKAFLVSSWALTANGQGVDLELQEEDAAIYDWAFGDATVPEVGGGTAIAPVVPVNITGLHVVSGNATIQLGADGTILARMLVTWDQVSNPLVISGGYIEVSYKRAVEASWSSAGIHPGTDTSCYIGGVNDGVIYLVRVRAINSIGQEGDWTQILHFCQGKSALPPDPTSLTLSTFADGTRRYAVAMPSLPPDLAGYEIRISASTAVWASMPVAFKIAVPQTAIESNLPPTGVWNIAVKAIDTSGNYSLNAATITGANIGAEPGVFVSRAAAINLVYNSNFPMDLDGMVPSYPNGQDPHLSILWRADANFNIGVAGAEGNILLNELVGTPFGPSQQTIVAYLTGIANSIANPKAWTQVSAGEWYEFSLYAMCFNCQAYFSVSWYDKNGTFISTDSALIPQFHVTALSYDDVERPWMLRQAPALAGFVLWSLSKYGPISPGASFIEASRLLFARAAPGQAAPSPWTPAPGPVGTGQIVPHAATDPLYSVGGAITLQAINQSSLWDDVSGSVLNELTYTNPTQGNIALEIDYTTNIQLQPGQPQPAPGWNWVDVYLARASGPGGFVLNRISPSPFLSGQALGFVVGYVTGALYSQQLIYVIGPGETLTVQLRGYNSTRFNPPGLLVANCIYSVLKVVGVKR